MNTPQYDGRPALSGAYDEMPPDRPPPTTDAVAEASRDEGGPGTELDLTGYTVEARDGISVGTVTEYATDHLVIRTSSFGNTTSMPIQLMHRVDHESRIIHVDEDADALRPGGAPPPS